MHIHMHEIQIIMVHAGTWLVWDACMHILVRATSSCTYMSVRVCVWARACLCVRVGMYSSWCFQHKHAHTYTPTHAHVHVHVHADAHGGSMCGRKASADCLSSRPQSTLAALQLDQRPAAGRVRRPYVASVSARALMRCASPLPPPRRFLPACLPFLLSFISPFIHPPLRCIWISNAHTCMHACVCMNAHTHTHNQSRMNIHMFVYSFTYACTHAHIHLHICMCICACSCVSVCICIRISVYIYEYTCMKRTYGYVYLYMYLHVYACTCTHVLEMHSPTYGMCMYVCMIWRVQQGAAVVQAAAYDLQYTCLHVFMYACIQACVYICMHVCMFVCMHVCLYVCMYVCMHVARLYCAGRQDSHFFQLCASLLALSGHSTP